jgi:HK97 family phage portal protein
VKLPFGLTIVRTKALRLVAAQQAKLQSVAAAGGRGWFPIIREPYTGAWQRNDELAVPSVLCYSVVYACVTLIASDIGKLRIKLVEEDAEGITVEIENPAYSPVLRKPNSYQNRIKFLEQWVVSKLLFGNTYLLKQRDARGVVRGLYVLDPSRVTVAVSPDGAVFYQLSTDNLAGLEAQVTVPAAEMIHDVMVPLYHPLIGVSPITACGLAAVQGLHVQANASNFFGNGANPSGVVTAPGHIPPEVVERLKTTWATEFTGENAGKVAIMGDGLKFEAMTMSAVDAQLIDQLKWTGENVCTAFHVPAYMVGVGPMPSYNNVEALQGQYYTQCLQTLIECIELLLDEGLGLASTLYTELDIDSLLRMDTATKTKAAADLIGSGAWAPNEARKRWFNLRGVAGGDSPYLQQQNYSLAALAKRDAKADPFAGATPPPAPTPPPTNPPMKAADAVLVTFDLVDTILAHEYQFAEAAL